MSIRSKTVLNGRVGIVDVRGSLVGDEGTDDFREAIADLLEQGIKNVVVDLGKINYVNSSGIGALIASHASCIKNGGRIKLARLTQSVQNLFAITKLIDVFDVYENVDEAVQSFVQEITYP